MMRMKWLLVSVLSGLAVVSWADGRGYEARTVTINAGVVAFGENDTAVRDVYTFYAMERRSDLKPIGVSFRNPFAPTRDADNNPVTRDRAAYWLVNLARLSDEQLARYQILLLSRTNWNGMTADIREKLRRFVDSGGMLWIDVPREGSTGRLWFPEVQLTNPPNTARVSVVNLNHPLLRGYYTLSPAEVAQLGLRGRGFGGTTIDTTANRPVLQVVTAAGNAPVIAAATYGSGRILVSAAGIAAAINEPLRLPNGNIPQRAFDLALQTVPDLELKFAYNLIRWAGAGSTDAFNQRRANAVADQYGAPLGIRWRVADGGFSEQGGAVVYGGLVFVVNNNELVCYDAVPKRDLDGDGRADDGILDFEHGERYDRVWRVEVPGGRISPPVIVEHPRGIQVVVATEQGVRAYWALPRGNDGRVPEVGQQAWAVSSPAPGSTLPIPARSGRIPAPIVIDNTILLVPTQHTVGNTTTAGFYAVLLSETPDVIRSQNVVPAEWYQPLNTTIGTWLLPPVAGYVPNYGQGSGNDIVVYMGVRNDPTGTGNQITESIRAFWIGAKGEILEPIIQGGVFQNAFRSRITGRARFFANADGTADPNNPLHPRVYVINRTTGELISEVTTECTFNVGTQGRVAITRPLPGDVTRDIALVIDYYIDWAFARDVGVMFRSQALLPAFSEGGALVPPQLLRGYTLAPNGVLYITTGTEETDPNNASGNIIALLEQAPLQAQGGTGAQPQARGVSRILWRWQSHGGYRQLVPGPERTERVVEASTIYNEPNRAFMDLVRNVLNFSHSFARDDANRPQLQWMNFTFRRAPIYYDGAVYAIGEGQARVGPFSFPYTVLITLDAEPNLFIINTGGPIGLTDNFQISIQQRDYARSGANPANNTLSTLTYQSRNPIPDIKIDFATGQIRIESFARANANGQINLIENVLSISQPVVVSVGNPPVNHIFVPESQLANWNNLRWYAVLLLTEPRAEPVIVGDLLYTPIVAINPFAQGEERNRVGLMALAIDPYRLQPDLAQRKDQAGVIPQIDPSNPLRYQTIVRWPFVDDLSEEFERDPDLGALLRALFERFAQNFERGNAASPIAVGEGLVLVSLANELRAYSRQTTIIADENRLLEVDTAGRVVWAAENTQLDLFAGSPIPTKQRFALTPNARVYRYSENEFLIVEPERNRVAIIDRAGSEVRVITRFIPDRVALRNDAGQIIDIIDLRDETHAQANNLPGSNYYSGAPETLRNPTDVSVWTEFVPAARNPYAVRRPLEYWIHYTITDAGNARIVDIVDRYEVDPNTFTIGEPVRHPQLGEMLGVLYWMTPSQRLGRNYRYVSAQRFEYWDGTRTRIGFATLVQNAAVSAFEATSIADPLDPATSEAGMVTLQLIVNGRDQTLYIRRMRLPDGTVVPILAPKSIDVAKQSASGQGPAGLYLLLTTSTGIYELQVPLTGTIGDTLPVSWMLPTEVYSNFIRTRIGGAELVRDPNNIPVRPILLRPRQARYLDNGNLLIVNSYSGETLVRSGGDVEVRDFPGEVFELESSDYNLQQDGLGFRPSSIVWSTLDKPALSGSYPLRKPSSADRGGF